jgi:hypothetical protein
VFDREFYPEFNKKNFVFLNSFDVLISKINFKKLKKYYFNIFSNKKHFENQFFLPSMNFKFTNYSLVQNFYLIRNKLLTIMVIKFGLGSKLF